MTSVFPHEPLRILLVDDSTALLGAVGDALRMAGHVVFVAQNGTDALEQFEPARFDLVLTDYAMPTPNGLELAHAIKARAPGQRVVMLSGYADALPTAGRPAEVDFVLRKPMSLEALKTAVSIIGSRRIVMREEEREALVLPL